MKKQNRNYLINKEKNKFIQKLSVFVNEQEKEMISNGLLSGNEAKAIISGVFAILGKTADYWKNLAKLN